MRTIRGIGIAVRLGVLVGLAVPQLAQAGPNQGATTGQSGRIGDPRDGQHDFDFNFGTWKTHVSRLVRPLTGSKTWLEYDGLATVSKVWDGRALLEELEASGPAGRMEGAGLRLYNSETRQWSLNWVRSENGVLQPPMIGGFANGRGEFYDAELFEGRQILGRSRFLDITPNSSRFEQAFSIDGGKTWETNWVMTFTRVTDGGPPEEGSALSKAGSVPGDRDASHDFDWEFGEWTLQVKRLTDPLSGSTNWLPMRGTVVVRKVWNGRANLAEIQVDGPKGRLEFLSLRLYNPKSHQWSLSFATAGSGTLSVPMFGEFKDGRGEFYDQEPFRSRAILVRFVFSAPSAEAGHSEQAFSADGGKTWETNWINDYTRFRAERRH